MFRMIGRRTRSEMDITTVFGTVIAGSNPAGCACNWSKKTALFASGFEGPEHITKQCEAGSRKFYEVKLSVTKSCRVRQRAVV